MNPSRRQLLASLIAGLFSWLWPKKIEAAAVVNAPAVPQVETYVYDYVGPVVTDHDGMVTTCVYDACNRLVEVVDYQTTTYHYYYDSDGRAEK